MPSNLPNGQLPSPSGLSEVISTLTHEIRQPLSTITNYSFAAQQLLQRSEIASQDVPKLQQWTGEISAEAQRMAELISVLRRFALSSTARETVSCRELIDSALEVKEIEPLPPTDRLHFVCPENTPAVSIDRAQVAMVIASQLRRLYRKNASDSTDTPQLNISVSHSDSLLKLTIARLGIESSKVPAQSPTEKIELTMCHWVLGQQGGNLTSDDSSVELTLPLPADA